MNELQDERIIPASGRLITIDILRGLAILWVVMYHLWAAAAEGYRFLPRPRFYYDAFWDRVLAGELVPALTAFTDLFFRLGNNGVTVFMVLSGVSLTISAMRSGGPLVPGSFYPNRLRKLLLPYWAGLLLYILTIAAIALYRVYADGGTFTHNFEWYILIHQGDPHQLAAAALMFPRALEFEYFFAPPEPLWFVFLLLQYYLLFPLLLPLVTRWGPLQFAVLGFAVSAVCSAWLIWEYGSIGARGYYWGGFFPFRFFEFAVGISIGYAMIEHGDLLRRLSRNMLFPLSLVAAGLALHTTGNWIDDSNGYWNAIGYPLITAGFASAVVAVVVCQPGFVLTSPLARLIAWVGPISYTVLIVNESFRILHRYLIVEGYQWTAGWWVFVVALYVPLTVLLAYPLAAVLGLVPKPAVGRTALVPAVTR